MAEWPESIVATFWSSFQVHQPKLKFDISYIFWVKLKLMW